eukprot:8130457-Pyramimonas_sp.AAC.1
MKGQPPRMSAGTKSLLGISFEENLDALGGSLHSELGPYGVSSVHTMYCTPRASRADRSAPSR